MLLDVLEVVAPVKHISKLRDFIEMKLPPGFPVKVDIPILPTITTRVRKELIYYLALFYRLAFLTNLFIYLEPGFLSGF